MKVGGAGAGPPGQLNEVGLSRLDQSEFPLQENTPPMRRPLPQLGYTALTLMLISLAGIVGISFTIKKILLITYHRLIPELPYLKTIERPIIFEGQDVVGDGEDVPVGRHQTPQVDGFS